MLAKAAIVLALSLSGVGAAPDNCPRNVTFTGPWTGGDAWLVDYSGPFLNDRPPHVQVGRSPDVKVGQFACLANCRAATSKAIEYDVLGVVNKAASDVGEVAHFTVFYGPDAKTEVATYCAEDTA